MAQKLIDLTGQKFNDLTVISRAPSLKSGNSRWHCLCDCGKTSVVTGWQLRKGNIKTCGCGRFSDGFRKDHAAEYQTWLGIKKRCYNKATHNYPIYGGRGIIVCDKWLDSFENFYHDMGTKPTPAHSIDRINNDGNYTPENCKWSTPVEQARNKSNTILITHLGKTQTVVEWANELSIPATTIYARISRGRSGVQAITDKNRYKR